MTGAASGIGKAAVASLLARGAAVVGLDLNPAVETLHARDDYLGLACDVTDERAIAAALERTARAFGGLDMLVLNAGIFPATRSIKDLGTDEWRKVMAVNLDANLLLMRECHPLLKLAPNGGRVVVIGSKNVPAPGSGRGGLLGVQGGAEPARARRRARMGRGRHPRQHAPSERGVRHRALDRRSARRARAAATA